ncbi:sensor histidine kinase [Acinetobacter shaoyimingii]|uniref:histidine kinase n=1 Tax=Acinetobacter shaoyimingii TaxID=2715164 RepID=A0A6G8RZH1_9GAMM|nr:ATP-binding protein [Acinetobacter shaoyimingii]NHB59196.1 histidine kinase [Acinetobacter shaoyimingii]QIO07133.1 histidine kinase [Acinetobacter shaoyimingii]
MSPKVSVPIFQTIYRLGISYTNYRVVLAFSLTLLFLLTINIQTDYYQYPNLYFYSLIAYIGSSIIQNVLLRYFHHGITKQFLALFYIDLIFLSSLSFALGGPNISIGLLFVIAVFAANFLLSKNQALVITLIAVISVIYQQLFGNLFSITTLNNIGNSALLGALFFVFYGIGQVSIQRFQVLESLNTHQSNELFKLQNINRYILEQIEVGYLVLDDHFKIIVINPAACSLLGISALYSHQPFHLMTFQSDLYNMLNTTLISDGHRFQFKSSQSSYTVDVRVQKLIVPHQALTLLILEDAQKLNQKVQQLKLAALGQLSASIAHEIRNPLAAIVQANELSQQSDVEQQHILREMISKQANRIDNIIKDTLDMAKNRKVFSTKINLHLFMHEFLQQDVYDIKDKILLNISDRPNIDFDESQLRQVLINLVRNAIRHNAADAEHIEINIYPKLNFIYIDVVDFGHGIDKSDQSKLFQPFFSTEINGTGLGLYLSHSICEANQAKLIYVEQKKQGACFRIECPIKD